MRRRRFKLLVIAYTGLVEYERAVLGSRRDFFALWAEAH